MSVFESLGLTRSKLSPDEVVRKHGPQVYKHLKRIFGPGADVDDVFQTVFVEVLRSLPNFRGRSKLSTWIRRITWNVAYQEMRSSYRHQCVGPIVEEPAFNGLATDDLAQQNRDLQRLYRALAELEPKQRSALLLHDIEGKTLKEAAEVLGRPLQTVASQVRVGRKNLTERMKQTASVREERGGDIEGGAGGMGS